MCKEGILGYWRLFAILSAEHIKMSLFAMNIVKLFGVWLF